MYRTYPHFWLPEVSIKTEPTLASTPGVSASISEDDPFKKRTCFLPHRQRDVPGASQPDNDVLIVDWDGPDDPENPKKCAHLNLLFSWTMRRKWTTTALVSLFTFITPVASTIIAPASTQVAQEFGITSSVTTALITSIFVLGYAIGPLILGPFSEIYGRSHVLQLANLWYLAWNLGCSFAQTTPQLIAFRLLASLGGSAPLSIGGGVLGDMFAPEQRGQALAIYSLAPLLGPVLGPICGAWIAERTTWRWAFWSTSFVDGGIAVAGFFFLYESFPPVLLARKADRIRKAQMDSEKGETHYKHIHTPFQNADHTWKHILAKGLVRPFALFVREPILQLLGVYMAFSFGLLYIFLTTIPSIFEGVYGQDAGIAGLHYIALGLGIGGASQVNAHTMDRIYMYLKAKHGGAGRPEYRLPSMVPATIFLPVGLLIVGWTVEYRVFWIGPDIGIVLVGAASILITQSIQAYVIDAFTLHAASALAAVSTLRSFAGFGFPLFAPAMYAGLGWGRANTVLAGVAVLIGCPAPWLFWKYGQRMRAGSRRLGGGTQEAFDAAAPHSAFVAGLVLSKGNEQSGTRGQRGTQRLENI
ncbi:MFS polyamine transporter [Athelia psychrophila]|uniref:MFS polyamine transporter n=1 Tax=Athelia psychrophila TaxID=1759441 RepID=A0A166UQT6_9AGAM|nr:MFS polyamine transporter [Fibularhizoctonia sp. CBS 109695]